MPNNADKDDRQQPLEQLHNMVVSRATQNAGFKRAIGELAQDLQFILTELEQDPEAWRLNRAFHVVHVPSFIAIITTLNNIDGMRALDDDEKHDIHTALNRATQLATDARRRLEQRQLKNLKVELDVLAHYAPEPAAPLGKPSLLLRARERVASLPVTTWEGVKSRAAPLPGLVDQLKDKITTSVDRASAVSLLAKNLQKSIAASLADTLTTPIGMRLNASSKALKHGLGTGVGLGVVVGVLCPPLLPVSAGGAVLIAMRSWRREMETAQDLNDAERAERIATLQAERSAALRQLTQGAPALQMETEDLSLTLDIETGQTDAVILTGTHLGRTWSSLDTLEKAAFVTTIADGAETILKLLEIGSQS